MGEQNRAVMVAGAALHVTEQGDPAGRSLLFLHGGGGSAQDFAALLPHFEDCRCVLLDSCGHGRSTLGTAALRYPQLARDAEAVIAACGMQAPVLVGHSDGGIAALHVAAAGRVPLGGIAVMAANGAAPSDAVIAGILSQVSAESWRQKFPDSTARYERINPAPDLAALIAALRELWCDTQMGNYPDAALLAQVNCPALVLGGEQDFLVPQQETVALAEAIPGAALELLAGEGHDFPETAPQQTAAALRRFLHSLP